MHEPVFFGIPLHLLFLYFIIYSFLGWCMETIYCSIPQRRFVPRGFLLGPICPIYGVGVLMMICWFAPFMGNPLLFYIVATVCMSAWEYFVGWFLETTTHIKYWDYSMHKYNLKGRICLWVSLTWGVLSYVILYWIHPGISQLVLKVPLNVRHILAIVLAALLTADTVTTIRKLALIAKLMRSLEEARVQLALGRAELEAVLQEARTRMSDRLEDAKEELSEKVAANIQEREAKHRERNERLQQAYDELLAKAELHSRRFLLRYSRMSSRQYDLDLDDLRQFGKQLRERLKRAKLQRKTKNNKR